MIASNQISYRFRVRSPRLDPDQLKVISCLKSQDSICDLAISPHPMSIQSTLSIFAADIVFKTFVEFI